MSGNGLKTVQLGNITYKLPFVDLVPIDARDRAALKASIQRVGKVCDPVLCWQQHKEFNQETIVDGANRVEIAAELGLDAVPRRYKGFETEEEAANECKELNLNRRHLSREVLEHERAARVERVVAARTEGKSTREIAEQEGVTQTQVLRDLDKATETGVSVEPPEGKVTGKDGRQRAAKVLCDRCKTVSPVTGIKDCPMCAELKKPKRKGTHPIPEPAERQPGEDDGPPLTDALGHEVPEPCAQAFADAQEFDALYKLAQQMQKGIDALSHKPGGKRLRAFLKPTGSEDKTINKSEHLNALKRDLNGTRPHAVCPVCMGKAKKDCKGCSGEGWVTATTWKDFDDATKGKLSK